MTGTNKMSKYTIYKKDLINAFNMNDLDDKIINELQKLLSIKKCFNYLIE